MKKADKRSLSMNISWRKIQRMKWLIVAVFLAMLVLVAIALFLSP